jgi:hypothetical protein
MIFLDTSPLTRFSLETIHRVCWTGSNPVGRGAKEIRIYNGFMSCFGKWEEREKKQIDPTCPVSEILYGFVD